MIADRQQHAEVEGNISGDKVAMSIDDAAMAHIMNVLTDLYSDPELAVIREYSTNALDAHREAGQTRPIEVTLPSDLAPFFTVEDFGVGLSVQDIHDIYSKYGASTKRETNDQVGMLGLGCKSALTYAQQFTLVAVQNGTKVTVSISRDADGAGNMTVVETAATDEHDGVKVVVPVKRYNDMTRKAHDFFRFWEPGTVLVNGEPPEHIDGLWISDDLVVVEDVGDTVVMGNVPYPVEGLDHRCEYGHGVVAFVNIGDVHFTPSREALSYTPVTNETVATIKEFFADAVKGAVQRAIDACDTPQDALKTMLDWHRILPGRAHAAHYTYDGRPMPQAYKADRVVVVDRSSSVLSRCNDTIKVGVQQWPNAIWFHGWERAKFTAAQRKKINAWLTDNDPEAKVKRFILVKDVPDLPWIDPENIVSWDEVNEIKLERTVSYLTGRIPGSYDMYIDGSLQYGVAADDIDTSKPLFYTAGGKNSAYYYNRVLSRHFPDCTIVEMPAGREAKFLRNFPKAVHVRDAARDLYKTWSKRIGKRKLTALAIRDAGATNKLLKLDASRVNDPALRKAIRAAGIDIKQEHMDRQVFLTVVPEVESIDWENPLDNYPLYNTHDMMYHSDHVYLYLNAAYAAQPKEAK